MNRDHEEAKALQDNAMMNVVITVFMIEFMSFFFLWALKAIGVF